MRCAAAHHGRALRVRATLGGSDDGAAQDGSARRRMELPKHGVSGALGLARGGVGLAFSVARGVMRAPDQLSKAAGVPDNPVNLTFNALDKTLGMVQKVTEGVIDMSQTVVDASFGLTDGVLDATETVAFHLNLDTNGFQRWDDYCADFYAEHGLNEDGYVTVLAQAIARTLHTNRDNAAVVAFLLTLLQHVDHGRRVSARELAAGVATLAMLQEVERRVVPAAASSPRWLHADAARVFRRRWREDVPHFVTFAAAAYGADWGRATGLAEQADTDTAFIVRVTGVPEGDVLLQSWETRPFCPGFVLVADRRTRSLVLAFRGTVSGADLITDLTAAAVPVPPQLLGSYTPASSSTTTQTHYVHAGFCAAAEALALELRAPVTEALSARPGYSLVVTGHSLGAAVGSLVALLWAAEGSFGAAVDVRGAARQSPRLPVLDDDINDDDGDVADARLPMRCYAYGPPGILSAELAAATAAAAAAAVVVVNATTEETRSDDEGGGATTTTATISTATTCCAPLVTSVVVGDDVVPRLSTSSASDVLAAATALCGPQYHAVRRLTQPPRAASAAADADADADDTPLSDAELLEALAAVRRDHMQHAPKLYPAGPVLWLGRRTAPAVALVEPTTFDEIPVVPTMFSDHPVTEYMAAAGELARVDGSPWM